MFIKVRKRQGKEEISYYFYKTENTRIDGKVKTKQEYVCRLTERMIINTDRLMNRETSYLRKIDFEAWLKIITKIQFDILKEESKALEI